MLPIRPTVRNEQPTDYVWSGQPGRATCLRTANAVAHIDCSIMPAVIPSGVWKRGRA